MQYLQVNEKKKHITTCMLAVPIFYLTHFTIFIAHIRSFLSAYFAKFSLFSFLIAMWLIFQFSIAGTAKE